eukprot:3362549-Amphidinium_carterae.2
MNNNKLVGRMTRIVGIRTAKGGTSSIASGSPGGDDPGRNPASNLMPSFDIFADELMKNAKDILPNAIRDRSPLRSRESGHGGGQGGGDPGRDPRDNPPGSPDGYQHRSPPRRAPGAPGGGGGGYPGGNGDPENGGDPNR